jgi:hypothetical protein
MFSGSTLRGFAPSDTGLADSLHGGNLEPLIANLRRGQYSLIRSSGRQFEQRPSRLLASDELLLPNDFNQQSEHAEANDNPD